MGFVNTGSEAKVKGQATGEGTKCRPIAVLINVFFKSAKELRRQGRCQNGPVDVIHRCPLDERHIERDALPASFVLNKVGPL